MIGWNRPVVVEQISDDRAIWFISDLHLGDGTPSDAFFGKDQQLIALVEQIEKQDGLLVIGGDAVDFHQAWSFTRILRAHQELFGALSPARPQWASHLRGGQPRLRPHPLPGAAGFPRL